MTIYITRCWSKKEKAVSETQNCQKHIWFQGKGGCSFIKDTKTKILTVKYGFYLQSEPTEDQETAAIFSDWGSASIMLTFNFVLHSTGEKDKGESLLKDFQKAFNLHTPLNPICICLFTPQSAKNSQN